jgi:clorobiocin biosynthesis protein CloN5
MTTDEVTRLLVAFIQENLLPEHEDLSIDETTPLLELGVLDSLKTAILLNYVRDELKTYVPPDLLTHAHFRNAGTIAALILEVAGSAALDDHA